MCDLWPEADVFTPVYDERGTESRFAHRNIYTSFLQRMRPTARNFRAFLPCTRPRSSRSTCPATTW
jgi:hypothetical protein